MAVSPREVEELAEQIKEMYQLAEYQILKTIALEMGKDLDDENWEQIKLRNIRKNLTKIQQIINSLNKGIPVKVEDIIRLSYQIGTDSVDEDLEEVEEEEDPEVETDDRVTRNFGRIDPAPLGNLVASSIGLLETSHFAILQNVNRRYRSIVAEASSLVLTGTMTRLQASQYALNKFADRGVTSYIDKNGRNWTIASYSEMIVRTATAHSVIQGVSDRAESRGRDLVIVSDSPEECEKCRPFEGKILSLTGETRGYQTLAYAKSRGLFHPGCTHTVTVYVKGLTKPFRPKNNPELYEARQHLRYLERGVRKWKSRMEVSLTLEDEIKAEEKLRDWEHRLKSHVKITGQRRKYNRESAETYKAR